MPRRNEPACRTNCKSWWNSLCTGMAPNPASGYGTARMPTGLGLWVSTASRLWHLSDGLWFRPWLGKPFLHCPLLPALHVDESKQLLVAQGHPSPTQPAASPGYRTDLPDLLTVINNSPSDGLMSPGVFLQAQLTSRTVLPTPFSMSVSKEGSALCPGSHPAALPAPCICLMVQPTHSAWGCCNIS